MQNVASMPRMSYGREIVLRSYLTASSLSPTRSPVSTLPSYQAVLRVCLRQRCLQESFLSNLGAKFVGQESRTDWKSTWSSSLRPFASLGRAAERKTLEKEVGEDARGAAKEVESVAGEDANRIGKPEVCTADELHYVPVPGTSWRLSLWRYLPSPSAPKRNHPVMMLSGIGTNAIGFDLDPNVSLARHIAAAGFDTWIVEVRGAGLSKREGEPTSSELGGTNGALTRAVQDAFIQGTIKSATNATSNLEKNHALEEMKAGTLAEQSKAIEKVNTTSPEQDSTASQLTSTVVQISQRLRSLLSEGQSRILSAQFIEQVSSLLEDVLLSERLLELRERLSSLLEGRQTTTMTTQISEFTRRMSQFLEEGQRTVSPSVFNLQERLNTTISEFQEVLDLIQKYDWDFDHYLEEDVPAAMEYVTSHSASTDRKVLGVGHSMGGILLYAMLATREERAGLAGAVAVASSLDYGVSDSSLKLLLPLADPAQLLNVPVVPLGALMSAIQPLVSRPPYALAYLGYQVSARQMMDPALFKKLILNNFCTVPVKLLLQLATVFQPRGLQNRQGTVFYKEQVKNCKVPVLAIAGDEDLICPPPAVVDTVNAFPQANVTYKLFGGQEDRHYGHYDLLCARSAKQEVFPVVQEFLVKCDGLKTNAGA